MGLGIPDTTTDDGSTDETGSSDGDTGEGNGRKKLSDLEGHLLRAVGEVVVTSRHEVEGTSGTGANNTSVVKGLGLVEVVAVLAVLLVVVVVVIRRGIGLAAVGIISSLTSVSADAGLVLVGQLEGMGGLENLHVLNAVRVVGASISEGILLVEDGNQVGTILLVTSISGLVGGVVVGSSPLEVDVVSTGDLEVVGSEIVLDTRVALDNVSTAAANTQVEDTRSGLNVGGTLGDLEGMRAILEGTSKLVGVDVEGEIAEEFLSVDSVVDVGVVGDGRLSTGGSVESVVDHLSVSLVDVGKAVVITRRDVVADTENAGGVVGVVSIVLNLRDDPLVGLSHQRGGDVDVTEMVITRESRSEALRSGDTPLLDLNPLGTASLAGSLTPEGSLVGGSIVLTPDSGDVGGVVPILIGNSSSSLNAHVLILDVLGLILVPSATRGLGSKDGNILPGGRSPIGVVVALLRALETVTVSVVSIGVLTGSLGRGSIGISGVLGGKEETSVATTLVASIVEAEGLLLSTGSSGEGVAGVVVDSSVTLVVSNGVGSTLLSSIANPGTAHVLQNHVTVNVGVVSTATVLDGPLDLKKRTLVVGHGISPLVSSLGVVLGVEKTVLVLSILILLIELVVGSTGRVEVAISRGGGQKPSQHEGD